MEADLNPLNFGVHTARTRAITQTIGKESWKWQCFGEWCAIDNEDEHCGTSQS